jgi:dihydroorotate dehydrogenase (NAD+) catalytic subunit
MGGIMSAEDVLEFMIVGASAVQIGTANFVDPFIWKKLRKGLTEHLERHRLKTVSELVGSLDLTAKDNTWSNS